MIYTKLIGIGREYDIPEGNSVLGRKFKDSVIETRIDKSGANIQIEELGMENISRYHCDLENRDSILRVKDSGSKNGTYINNEELEPHKSYELRNLDLLRLGDCTLEVKIKQGLFG